MEKQSEKTTLQGLAEDGAHLRRSAWKTQLNLENVPRLLKSPGLVSLSSALRGFPKFYVRLCLYL